jgi:DNA-binding NarL/FixJ family response regulator
MAFLKTISILIADDHPMLLKGLYDEMLERGFNVVAQAANGQEAWEKLLEHKPKLALLDIDMPFYTGFEVVKMARKEGLDTKFIILSFHKEKEYVAQAKNLGIDGYLLKEDTIQDIESCMRAVLDNRPFFSRSFQPEALEDISSGLEKLRLLTPSEVKILKMVASGKTTTEISELLGVSSRTVEKHRSNIIMKLDIPSGTNSLLNWTFGNKKSINAL